MRKINFTEGEYYHIYNRGVDKRTIFSSNSEYNRFLGYLYLLNTQGSVKAEAIFSGRKNNGKSIFSIKIEDQLVAIGAYCLMPNHFHILVTPLVDGGVSKFMQRLQTAYTMYFNEKHKRSGSLLQGTYKAQHVDKDQYLKYLFAYIHLNPAKLFDPRWKEDGVKNLKKLKKQIMEYPYSSIHDYTSSNFTILNPRPFPKYFEMSTDFESQILFWLSFKDKIHNLRGLASQVMHST